MVQSQCVSKDQDDFEKSDYFSSNLWVGIDRHGSMQMKGGSEAMAVSQFVSLLVTVASTMDQLPLLVHCFRCVIAPAYTRLLIPFSHHTAFITFLRFQHPACNILKEDLGRRDILSSPAIYSISGIQAALGHAGPKQRCGPNIRDLAVEHDCQGSVSFSCWLPLSYCHLSET